MPNERAKSVQKRANLVELETCCQTHTSILMYFEYYFLAKFRFDTAENEPVKNLQIYENFPEFFDPVSPLNIALRTVDGPPRPRALWPNFPQR